MKRSGGTALVVILGGLSLLGGPSSPLLATPCAGRLVKAPPDQGPSVRTRWNALEFTLTVPRPEFRAGEPVEARLIVENTGDAPIVLGDVPFKTFDLAVYDRTGTVIWVWSETRPPLPLAIPGFRHLNRADTFTGALVWDQTLGGLSKGAPRPAPRGTYLLEGVVHLTFPHGRPVTLRSPPLPVVLQN